jgi:hypothetical protein
MYIALQIEGLKAQAWAIALQGAIPEPVKATFAAKSTS